MNGEKIELVSVLSRGHGEGGRLTRSKKSKTPFFRDIGNSFHEVTHIGLEPHQIFSF